MKMPVGRDGLSRTFLLAISLAGWAACSLDKDPHYGGEKTYGQKPAPEAPDQRPTPRPDGTPPDDPPPVTPPPGMGSTPPDGDGDRRTPPPPDLPPPMDPGRIIYDASYRGWLNTSSAFKLEDGEEPGPFTGLIEKMILERIAQDPDDTMALRQTLGDGSRSLLSQDIDLASGDFAAMTGDSDTGRQSIQRIVMTDHCFAPFVCAEKMLFEPAEGTPKTYCYYDPESGDPVAIPYGAAPNFSREDFEGVQGDFGPFVVKSFEGLDVDCQAPAGPPQTTVTIAVSMKVVDPPQEAFRFMDAADRPVPDFGIVIAHRKAAGDTDRPYLDQTSRLQTKTTFWIESENALLVGIDKTIRKSLQGEGSGFWTRWLGSLAHLLVPFDGIQIDWHLELCEDRRDPDNIRHYCQAVPGGGER